MGMCKIRRATAMAQPGPRASQASPASLAALALQKAVEEGINRPGGRRRTCASPTRSGPEGSSRNEFPHGLLSGLPPATYFNALLKERHATKGEFAPHGWFV
jgi:hypothetical protein